MKNVSRTTRCVLALAAMFVALVGLAPAAATAQDIKCPCDYIEVRVDGNVACKVTVCYQLSPLGKTFCKTIEPGTSDRIPCPIYCFGIQPCTGAAFCQPGLPNLCTPIVQVDKNCCVKGCLVPDADCRTIRISATPCPADDC